MSYEYINTAGSMSLRSVANVNNTSIGSLSINTKAYGNEVVILDNGDKWLKVLKIDGMTLPVGNVYVAVIHLSKPYGKLTEIPDEVPPPPPPPTSVPAFPEYFILTDPKGVKARFDFTREVE